MSYIMQRILLSAMLLMFLSQFSVRASPRPVLEKSRSIRNLIAADPIEGLRAKHHKPNFKPGPWSNAHITFYGGADGSGTIDGGACGYGSEHGFGVMNAALSPGLFKEGFGCGSCYEIKCVSDPRWCKPGASSITVTGNNLCPDNDALPHFDLAQPAFAQIADKTGGNIPVQYRKVPCHRQGGIRFTISGNPYYNKVFVWNVAGAGDIKMVKVKGSQKLKWTEMRRDWGMNWVTDAMLVGEELTFRVIASDGRSSTSWHITPENWQYGQTYEGKNFR